MRKSEKGVHYDYPDNPYESVTAEGRGTLSVFEGSRDVPFDIKRIYYIHGAPQGTQRGGHAHKALRQVLWCPYGSS